MPIPVSIVTITVIKLQVSQEIYSQKNVFGLISIGGRLMGRTRPITGPTVPVGFTREVAIPPGQQDFFIEIEIWQNRGVLPPLKLQEYRLKVTPTREVLPERTLPAPGPPGVTFKISVRLVPGGQPLPAFVPRQSSAAEPVRAVLAPPRAFIVVIEEILGLYQPTDAAWPAPRAVAVPGYTSQDQRGRIFLNRNPDGTWFSGRQFINLRARVHVPLGLQTLPPNPKIRWTVQDPDDPINDDPRCHPRAGSYLDSNDYANAASIGARDRDNEGIISAPRWEQVGGPWALAIESNELATTAVDGAGNSWVRIHCPDLAGDNLIVRAELLGVPPDQLFPAETGVMTMWQKIDVEYVQLANAHALPVAGVPQYFEPSCIQLDFTAARPEPAQEYVAPSSEQYDALTFADSKFQNRNTPGWFCLIAACWAYPVRPAVPQPGVPQDRVTIRGRIHNNGDGTESVLVPGNHTYVQSVIFRWTDGQDRNHFSLFPAGEKRLLPSSQNPQQTQILLVPHDITPDFTAGDGSHAHFYNQRRMFYPMSGYGVPPELDVVLCPPGAGQATSGTSPSAPLNNTRFWRGRTIIYTHHPANHDQEAVLRTIVHELTHAFGLPHKCGLFAWRTYPVGVDTALGTCNMNYNENWMINGDALLPGTSGRVVPDHCYRHVKELRRTRIHRNPGFNW